MEDAGVLKTSLGFVFFVMLTIFVLSEEARELLKGIGMILLAGFIYFVTYPPTLDSKIDLAILAVFAVVLIAAILKKFIKGEDQ